ncbi:deoxyribodipyrimidine photo-lyase [Roseibium aquae]|uniref:Deoxyribodipyrimidine photo-lyase n=1 Tax=Roseibium aquae TaxID=1323746 RepID=A0A916WXS4_9HYPH|nr:deoxyribodipyrimidine photo-lyase [Roseibium aquae]GGB42153.1 deoxyribodipyrimidine photo-lyase [Roseibium aquae]
MTTIVWFRQDLRLADNPALTAAASAGTVIPVFIWDEMADLTNSQPLGGAGKWWLHHSLAMLARDLGGLVLRTGDPKQELLDLVDKTGATAVRWNRCYDPYAIKRDAVIKTALKDKGLEVESHRAALMFEPWTIETKSGGPYKVFTPFWRAVREIGLDRPLPSPAKLVVDPAPGLDLGDLALLPQSPDWAEGWDRMWTPGERGAHKRLAEFVETGLAGYAEKRNRPDLPNVSRLSPFLRYGNISPRQAWVAASDARDLMPFLQQDAETFMSELVWREFSYHLLYHFPDLPTENWKRTFDAYPWVEDAAALRAWQTGRTGYPIVDAGMRELWQTGYMHNRVRMIVGSFLIKHLRQHWRHGEAWFRDTLLDADLASNAASWQWVAGSGADAAPYFRIFNPYTQGQKFDPEGDYVRKWVPELKDLPAPYLHTPHMAPQSALEKAGIRLGDTYPLPIVDHAAARKAALAGYEQIKGA